MILPTINQRLKRSAGPEFAKRGIVFIDRKEQETFFSWADIYQRAQMAAGYLRKLGIQKGDRVAIVLPTGISFIDSFLGCQLIGAIPVPLYPPVRLGRLDEYFEKTASMLQAANICALVTDRKIKRIIGQVIARYNPKHGVILEANLQQGPSYNGDQISPDHLAMAQFSSGTTQHPKPVGLTHRQILSNVDAILGSISADEINSNPSGCSWLPLYHDMGLIGCIFPALSYPGTICLIPPEVFLAKPAIWLRAISRHKTLLSPAPNFAYAYCTERIKDKDLEGCDLSSWKIALNGAEPVAPEHIRSFIERFQKYGFHPNALTPVYGLAEASLAVSFSELEEKFKTVFFDREALQNGMASVATTDQLVTEMASVGKPLTGFDIQIRDDENNLLPADRIGQIWVKGPSIMQGYLNNTPSPIQDGWLQTGDIGFVHEEELFISGRAKDIIILRGRNHSPHDIEQAVDNVEGVRTGCAVAVSDISNGAEKILLFVEYRAQRPGLLADCRKAVLKATGINLDEIVLLAPGTIPRTSSGKLRRKETLKRFHASKLVPPKKVTSLYIAGAFAKSAIGYMKRKQS